MPGISPIVPGLPGVRGLKTATPRIVFRQVDLMGTLAQGRVIDGTKSRDSGNTGDTDRLRPGLLMGKVTSGGKLANSILGVLQSAYTSGGTELAVTPAQAVEIARRVGTSGTGTLKAIGPPSAAGTVAATSITFSAINTTTGVITVTSLGVNKIAGTYITAADGSETPITLIPDGWPIPVTDADGSSIDAQMPEVPVAGIIDPAQIVDWPSDTSLIAWVKAALNAVGQYVFSDSY